MDGVVCGLPQEMQKRFDLISTKNKQRRYNKISIFDRSLVFFNSLLK